MIFDGENMFCDEKTLSADTLYTDVVNLGPGESYQPMFLETFVNDGTGSGATLTVTIQTATDAAFTEAVALGEFELSGADARHSLPMPRGNLGYVRLKLVSTYTGGKVSAGLVVDDEIAHRK
jgi:hypothetical protein